MSKPAPAGIVDLEAVARGRAPAAAVARATKEDLLSDDPATVAEATRTILMVEAYARRARFEQQHFAAVPAYKVVADFAFPLQMNTDDVARVLGNLAGWARSGQHNPEEMQRALTSLNYALPLIGEPDFPLSQSARTSRGMGSTSGAAEWFPGSNYSEAPMKAQGVASFADEYELVHALGQRIQETVARVARVTGCPYAHGNHAKATVVRATMEAHPAAREEFKRLLGSAPMEGGLRLSNSSPELNTVDHKGNLIGMRYSFMTDHESEAFTTSNAEGGWFTLTANSAPAAHVETPERHIAFTNSVGSPHATLVETLQSIFGTSDSVLDGLRDVARTVREVMRAIPQGKVVGAHPRLNELTFHSRHAYRLGAQAVRYQCRVIDPTFRAARDDWRHDPDYRHRELLYVLERGDVVVEILLQVLPDYMGPAATETTLHMIENMRADWTGIPGEPFALVRLPRQSVAPTPERSRMVQWFAHNPVDLLAAGGPMAPLGAAGRARTIVYEASRAARAQSDPLGLPLRLEVLAEVARRANVDQ